MLQIRIHGRGGQGVVTAAEMLSVAAHLFGTPGHPEMLARIQADADRNIRRFGLLDEAAP
jgi:hypothetical protein